MKKKGNIKVVDKVRFHSGNYEGLTGTVTAVDWDSNNSLAIFRVWHEVELSNGEIGHIEKSEHWDFI